MLSHYKRHERAVDDTSEAQAPLKVSVTDADRSPRDLRAQSGRSTAPVVQAETHGVYHIDHSPSISQSANQFHVPGMARETNSVPSIVLGTTGSTIQPQPGAIQRIARDTRACFDPRHPTPAVGTGSHWTRETELKNDKLSMLAPPVVDMPPKTTWKHRAISFSYKHEGGIGVE